MRLIDADKLTDDVETYKDEMCDEPQVARHILNLICNAPTVDQWHYPSRGEYPTEGEEVLCCLKRPDGFVKNWYETGYYNGQEWACNVDEDFLSDLVMSGYKLEVIAWQYIIPPKEEA